MRINGKTFHGKNSHGTKKGPGRYNRLRARSRQQLSPALAGGNWQGKGYLSYAEVDTITREVANNRAAWEQTMTSKGIRKFEEKFLCEKREGKHK